MLLKTIVVGALATNCYLLADEIAGEALVVDPGAEGEQVARALVDAGLRPVLVVSTHSHFDHTGGVRALREAYSKAKQVPPPYGTHANDAVTLGRGEALRQAFPGFQNPPPPERSLRDGEVVMVGALHVLVLETPGHTLGSVCLYVASEHVVFTGDTLFQMSIGRTDFPGGNREQELTSIRTKLLVLPEETRVYPGHGPSTTIGQEKRLNPFLRS
ncbi:MAG: MBL fold metallo-hydrolase [Dehalococcoidia bacterium]|nr:MBL fold metallo-hydrolase [Dehalococcoidia bacterium]